MPLRSAATTSPSSLGFQYAWTSIVGPDGQAQLRRQLQNFLEAFFWANYAEPDFFWLDSGQGEYCLPDASSSASLGRFAFLGFQATQHLQYFSDGLLQGTKHSSHCQPQEALEAVASLARAQSKQLPQVFTADGLALPFRAGVVGAVAYEFGYALQPGFSPARQAEEAENRTLRQVLFQFSAYDAVLAVDLQQASYIVTGNPQSPAFVLLQRRAAQAKDCIQKNTADLLEDMAPAWRVQCQYSYAEYQKKFAKIKLYLQQGEIYQLNFTQQLQLSLEDDKALSEKHLAQLYLTLRREHPVPFGAYWGTYWAGCPELPQPILSFSPERFYQLDAVRAEIHTRPMKGTRARQSDPEQDAAAVQELCQSSKERAELLMICDLLRNDLYRICQADSVSLSASSKSDKPNGAVARSCWPFQMEQYPSVWQQTASVSGRLQPAIAGFTKSAKPDSHAAIGHIWQALFPCGSITGAPKIRAMQLIAELESLPRRWYTGNFGYIDCDGNMEFNVLIRSFFRQPLDKNGLKDRLLYHVGGGIVWDSQVSSEWQELETKCRFFLDALKLRFPDFRGGIQ